MATAPSSPTKPRLGVVVARRAVIALALMVLMLVPVLVLLGLTGQPAATYAAMGTITGISAALAAGFRIGVLTAIVMALLAPIALVSGLSPVTGAALMALMTLTVGRMSRFGLHRAVMLVPVFIAWPIISPVPWLPRDRLDQLNELLATKGLTLAQALTAVGPTQSGSSGDAFTQVMVHQRMDSTYLAWVAAFFFIGAIIPVLLSPLVRSKVPVPAPVPHPRSEALPYTITIAVLTSGATFYFLSNPQVPGGAFLIATILVLAQVGNDVQWRLTIERVLGTIGGVLVFIVAMQLMGGNPFVEVLGIPFPLKMYSIGLVFGVLAIMAKFSPRHWIYYIVITPTTAFLNAFTVNQAGGMGRARLVDNVVGAALVVAAALITIAAGRIAERTAPAPT